MLSALRATEGVEQVDALGTREADSADYLLHAREGCDIRRAVFAAMAERGWPILIQRPVDLELEDVFLQLTGDSGEEA